LVEVDETVSSKTSPDIQCANVVKGKASLVAVSQQALLHGPQPRTGSNLKSTNRLASLPQDEDETWLNRDEYSFGISCSKNVELSLRHF
jgi:hypothetical protein